MKYILVDCMALCHAAFHAMEKKPLIYKGENVSVIYGFLNSLLDVYNEFERKWGDELVASEICFIWDSKKSKRKSIYFEEYKVKRKDKRKQLTAEEKEALQDMFDQAYLLRTEILPDLGFKNIFIQAGYEGDDIIGSIIKNERYSYDEFVMVTCDKDMYQLLSPNVSFWNNRKGLYTYQNFRDEWGIVPAQWVDVKAIGGCTSDCVPGVPGVAEKTVCSYLNNELKTTSKKYQSITSEYGKAVANFNRVLVELPFPGVKKFKIENSTELDVEEFWDLFEFYGFKHFLEERDDEWIKFCESGKIPF